MIIQHSLDQLLFEFPSRLFFKNKIKKPSNSLPRRAERRFYQVFFFFFPPPEFPKFPFYTCKCTFIYSLRTADFSRTNFQEIRRRSTELIAYSCCQLSSQWKETCGKESLVFAAPMYEMLIHIYRRLFYLNQSGKKFRKLGQHSIQPLKSIMPLTAQVFTKLRNTQRYIIDISYTEYYPNRIKMQKIEEKVNLQSQVKFGIQRTKLVTAQWKNTGNLYIKFHPIRPRNVETRGRKSFTTLSNV